jgi:hypothetical protein
VQVAGRGPVFGKAVCRSKVLPSLRDLDVLDPVPQG